MSNETGIMKTIVEILKEKPFIWVVLFLACSVLLFSPLLEFLGSNFIPISVTAFIRILVGITWIISASAILCSIIRYLYKRTVSFFKIKKIEKKIVKELSNLSYQEKLMLYMGVRLNMSVVYAQIDNSIAQTLVSKGILTTSITIADPLKYPFRIPDYIWKLIMLRKAGIFKEFENKQDEELMREYQGLL